MKACMKRLLSLFLALTALVSVLCVPASAANRDWESAYTTAMKENKETWGSVFQLIDLDLNGTPELLIGSLPGSGLFSILDCAFTYENGELKEIPVDDTDGYTMISTHDPAYTLYRNPSTGETRIEGGYTQRAGSGYYTILKGYYSYNGSEIVFEEVYTDDVAGSKETYYVNGQKTTASKYESAYNARNDGWEACYLSFAELTTGYKEKLTTSKLETFFAAYKDKSSISALPSKHKIQVDGQSVSLGIYNINGNNYFKLRDVAALLSGTKAQFEVGYDKATRQITLTTGQSYTSVGGELAENGSVKALGLPTTSTIYLDGQEVSFTAYNINGNNYFKIRDLGQALGFDVTWDNSTKTVNINSNQTYQG